MNPTKRQRRRASSLVEVLVVLVILLIGVFAVIRVFPIGFSYLRNNESRLRSTRLAHALMEKTQDESSNLPEAICYSYFSWNGTQFVRQFVVDEDPDDLTGDPTNAYYKDVNKFRFIVGEPVKIGLPTPTASAVGAGSIYTPKFGPIYMDSLVGDPGQAPSTTALRQYFNLFLAVNSAGLKVSYGIYRPGNESFYQSRLTGPQMCVIDSNEDANGGAWIMFYPSTRPRTFKIRYSKALNDHDDNTVDSVVAMTEELIVPAGTTPVWQAIPGVAGDDVILTGSEVVTREFDRLAVNAAWDPEDPYQYKLLSANLDQPAGGTTDKPRANLGILSFNPSGARFVNNGRDPFKAYIDYAVIDWHIIHDDRDIPAAVAGADGEVPVRTTLTRLKSLDYINPDNTFYEGIFPAGDTDPNHNTDILIVRMDTGAILNSARNGRPGDYGFKAGADAGLDYWANTDPKTGSYATGTFYVNTNNVPAGTPIRIFYKAQGEWASSLNKAMATYRLTSGLWLGSLVNVSLDSTDPTQDRFVDSSLPDKFWMGTTVGTAALYFARTELNKSVVATFQVRVSGTWRRSQPVQLTLDTPETQSVGANTVNVASVSVTKYLRRLGWDGDPNNWEVAGSIKGVSVKSRVVWKDGQEKNAPWRIQDLDTYLTQSILQ